MCGGIHEGALLSNSQLFNISTFRVGIELNFNRIPDFSEGFWELETRRREKYF